MTNSCPSNNHGHHQVEKKIRKLGTEKEDFIKKVYKLGEYDGVDVALIIRQNGRFFAHRLVNHESWPPSMKEIVRLCRTDMPMYAKLRAASFKWCMLDLPGCLEVKNTHNAMPPVPDYRMYAF
jgi:hypothetical protein